MIARTLIADNIAHIREILCNRLKVMLCGKRLLFRLVTQLVFGWSMIIVGIYFLSGIISLNSIVLGLFISVFVIIYRFKQFKQRINGNIYLDKTDIKKRLSLDFVLFILVVSMSPVLMHPLWAKFVLIPLAFPFPITTLVLLVWLIKYEAKFGPVFIK